MNKLVMFSALLLAMVSVVGHAGSSKEVSPHALGERSVFSERAIAERLRPTGNVCVAGEDCGVTVAQADTDQGPRSGEQVYNSACVACHASGAAGAPKLGDVAAWDARQSAKSRDELVQSTWNGLGAMPAKGMCTDCSEEEIGAAVDYILEQSQ